LSKAIASSLHIFDFKKFSPTRRKRKVKKMIKLTAKQIQAAHMLAPGQKCQDVAKEIEVTPQTISAWKKDQGFTVYQNRFKMELVEAA
jgi:DNA-binding NarL/FixJ family response regulator